MRLPDMKTIIAVILLLLLLSGVGYLFSIYMERSLEKTIDLYALIPPVIGSALVLVGALILRTALLLLAEKAMARYPVDLIESAKTTITATIVSLSFILILAIFTNSIFVVSFFVVGFVIMLLYASRDIIEDFVIRLVLLSTPSMNLGDYVQIGDVRGRIIEFGAMYTSIRKDDNSIVCMPNKLILSSNVVNFSKSPHLKFQDSVELEVGRVEAEALARRIQEEMERAGFKKTRVTHIQVGERTKFIASLTIEDPQEIQPASHALSKVFKKMLTETSRGR
ncbi:MAG: mechanosensitive ion channel domain-containing protein [Candidatus Micrarchaeota archaeon]